MKTYYQNDTTINKAYNLALSSCVESPNLTISRNNIKFPYAILSFTDGLIMPLYAPQICEVPSRFKNDYENCLSCYSDDDKFGFRDIDIRLDSLAMIIDDTLEIDGGFMILNSEKQHLRFSELALQNSFLRKDGKEYIVKSGLSEEIIYVLNNNFSITPSSVLLTDLWEYINDDNLEFNQDLKKDLFAFGEIDFRKSDKPLNVFNAEFKSALIFEICEYFANNGNF